jgi:hypothetical protein
LLPGVPTVIAFIVCGMVGVGSLIGVRLWWHR